MKSILAAAERRVEYFGNWRDPAEIIARSESIASLASPRKEVAQSLDKIFAVRDGQLGRCVLSAATRLTSEVRFLGVGAKATVYKMGDEVVKVIRHTKDMSTRQMEEAVDLESSAAQSVYDTVDPDLMVRQEYVIDAHPVVNFTCVVARQAFVSGTGITLFKTNSTEFSDGVKLVASSSKARADMGRVVGSVLDCYGEGLPVIDLNGRKNFILNERGLVSIDPDPVTPKYDFSYNLVRDQALALHRKLRAA